MDKDAQDIETPEDDEKSFNTLMGEAIDEHLDENKDNDVDNDGKDADLSSEPEAKPDTPGTAPDGADTERPEGDGLGNEPDGEKVDDTKKVDGEEKEEDPDLEEPEGLSEDASERFQTLANKNRELSTKFEDSEKRGQEFEGNYTRLADLVDSSNATADEFTELISFSRQAKSESLAERQQAYNTAISFINAIAPTIGVSLGPDPLEGFPDLRTKVDSVELDEASAAEIANARRLQQAQAQDQQNQSQMGMQQQNAQNVSAAAQNEVSALINEWTQDPAWESKAPMITEYAQGLTQQVLSGQVSPAAVPGLMQGQYASITKVMSQLVDEQRKRTATNQPMRPTPDISNAAEPAPKNFADGMMAAIDKIQGQ